MAQGELPGLYDTLLEPKLERTEYDDWTYRRTFALDADMLAAPSIELVFEGIDTYAEIALNGQVLGRTENMFVPVRFDIKAAAAAHNELTVRIFSPTNTLLAKERAFGEPLQLWNGIPARQHFILQSRKHRREGYGERLFFDVIGEACAHDTLRPYWPTSPYDLSVEGSGDSQDRGDMHYWQVWGQTQPYENYGTINARFVSEFGMQSYPSMKVMDGVDAEADLRDPQFDAMQKAPNGIQRLPYYTAGDYRLPADKRGFVYVNQLMQANALRLAVEHWMSRMPDTSGALIWQWADLWPSISWAIVEFDKVHKLSYFYQKRSFQSPNAIAQIKPGAMGKKAAWRSFDDLGRLVHFRRMRRLVVGRLARSRSIFPGNAFGL